MSKGGLIAPGIQGSFTLALLMSGVFNRIDRCRIYIDSDCDYEVIYCQSYLAIAHKSVVYAIIKANTSCRGTTIIYDNMLTYFNEVLQLNPGINVIQIHIWEPKD